MLQLGLADLGDLDPDMHKTAVMIQGINKINFAGLLEAEGLPKNTKREAYVAMMIQRVLVDEVKWQVPAMRAGFQQALGKHGLQVCACNCASNSSECAAVDAIAAHRRHGLVRDGVRPDAERGHRHRHSAPL